jgi:Holliday junction resolvase RusA-like endonuclease
MSDNVQPEPLLRIRIPGEPTGQGSLTPRVTPNGRPYATPNRRSLSARADAAAALRAAWQAHHDTGHPDAVTVSARFVFTRPAAHWLPVNRNRSAPVLRVDAPRWPTGRNHSDTDRLCRLLGDALQLAEVLADDALIVAWRAEKVYADVHGVQGWTDVVVRPAT